MATAIRSIIFGRGRHPHERVETEENPDGDANSLVEGGQLSSASDSRSSGSGVPAAVRSNSGEEDNDSDMESQDLGVETVRSDDEAEEEENPTTAEEGEDEGYLTHVIPRSNNRNTVTLSELEEERELARRRTSACVLLAVFVLFRLWIEALQNGDIFVMMLCLFGTSWTARLIRHNREREEALDERIRAYLENADPNTTEIDRNDLRFLSFQAQLALAMMESQRQMAGGGFGHPDGNNVSQGLSDGAKEKWEHFQFKDTEEEKMKMKKGDYGAVAHKDVLGYEEDGPHCSICLGEYEEGEKLVKLPCNHIYHEECVDSWTTNHIRCPLCNLDLESVTAEPSSTHPEEDSIV